MFPMRFEGAQSPPMPHWFSAESAPYCLHHQNWEKSCDQSYQFDSELSSVVSSPVASGSNLGSEGIAIREISGKVGSIGGRTDTSCYTSPLHSSLNTNYPATDQSLDTNMNFPEFVSDAEFAERAPRFSCFGGSPVLEIEDHRKLIRSCSSPSLDAVGLGKRNRNTQLLGRSAFGNTSQESSVSEQNKRNDISLKMKTASTGRKRKVIKANEKDLVSSQLLRNSTKISEIVEDAVENGNGYYGCDKEDEDGKGSESENRRNANNKPREASSDYIHVRARRGQATDSHSLAERIRREKISERMKLLQNLVPGCNKITGKALMLDEIINYVQSLQRQVEFLSLKLAAVSHHPKLDFNTETVISKDIFPLNNNTLPRPAFLFDSSATTTTTTIYDRQLQQDGSNHATLTNGTLTQRPVDSLHASTLPQNHQLHVQLHQLSGFDSTLTHGQYSCDDDLQTIVQMGFAFEPNLRETTL